MKQHKKTTGSRRKTPWTDSSNATGLQKFIDRHNQENYYDKHPLVRDSDEWEFLNLMEAERCPILRERGYKPFRIYSQPYQEIQVRELPSDVYCPDRNRVRFAQDTDF